MRLWAPTYSSPPLRTEAFRKLSNRCPLSRDYSFISTLLLHISLPLFFRLDSISLRNKGNCSPWRYLGESRPLNESTCIHTHTHTRVYMYHKLLLLYRYEISTLDVSNFFFLLRVFVVILSLSLQTSFHSRNLLSCFWVEPVKFVFFLPFFGRIICKTDLGWKD